METGNIIIKMEVGKIPAIEAELVKNTLWMTKEEICKFFNCYHRTVESNLKSIFQNHLLWENECTYTYRFIFNGVECQRFYYNMDVLIFLSYRIGTREAQIFRRFINQSFREYVKRRRKSEKYKIVWIEPPSYN